MANHYLKSPELSLFLGAKGGPGKTTLSLFKDVTIRSGRAGVKGKSDDVTLYDFFVEGVPKIVRGDRPSLSLPSRNTHGERPIQLS